MLSPWKILITKIPVVGKLYGMYIYNRRHSRYSSMYDRPFINEISIIEGFRENKVLLTTDCSNCMLCIYSRITYIPFKETILLCTHKNQNSCNSFGIIDDFLNGFIPAWVNEFEFYNITLPKEFDSDAKDRVGLLIRTGTEFIGSNGSIICDSSKDLSPLKKLQFFNDREISEAIDKINDLRMNMEDARLLDVSAFDGEICIEKDMTEKYIDMRLIVTTTNQGGF